MRSCPRDRVDKAHVGFTAAHAELLGAVAELDSDGSWRADGAAHLAGWLSARFQVGYATAREWVESARALRDRPALNDAYSSGEISCDQMKALNTLARPQTDDDELWLESITGPNWPIHSLQREARKARARELERRDDGRYLSMEWTRDERFLKVDARLHPDEGSVFMKAIDRAVPAGTNWKDIDKLRADGLVALAQVAVASDADPDRATVVVHVDETTLRGDDNLTASLDSGAFIQAETARRLSCDARIETVANERTRRPVTIKPASRNVPPSLYRQLRHRDQTCVFPGCERRRFLQAHHVLHYSRGGPTVLSNLVLLCSHHHHLVHEEGWSLRGQAGPGISWVRPGGNLFRPREGSLDTS